LSYLLTRLLILVSTRTGWMLDDPQQAQRRIHRRPTPRIGGVVLLPALVITLIFVLPADLQQNQQIQGFIVGALLISLVGITDDFRSLSGPIKLVAQVIIITFVVIRYQLLIPYVNNPLEEGIITFPSWSAALVSIAWILVTTNLINFIDGIDGLADSVTLAFTIVVGLVAVLFNQLGLAVILAALFGCGVGFLPLNWHRARAFLGDGGAMFLGFTVGVLSILSGAKLATALLVLGLPILDVVNTFVVRVSRGQSPFTADNEHLHYRLIRKGLTAGQTVLLISGISFAFGLLALVNNTPFKVISLIVLGVISQGLILWSMRE
jgi:UDP-GlcNAc:undecaprenyl-phosphate GlcNAc-1-phosphate transferase